eukprot:66062_1
MNINTVEENTNGVEENINNVEENNSHLVDPNKDSTQLKKQTSFRWIVLFVSCWAMFGVYYCYDNPTALSYEIKSKYNLSSTKYNILYSAYSLPNIILPFFGGLLCDKIGSQYSLLVFLLLTTFGQLIFAISTLLTNFTYPLMLIGRCISGVGGASVPVAKSKLLSIYFLGNEISFAMGVTLSIGRIGSSLNDYLTLKIYNYFNNIFYALFFGFMILCICIIFVIIMIILENRKQKTNDKINDSNVKKKKRVIFFIDVC